MATVQRVPSGQQVHSTDNRSKVRVYREREVQFGSVHCELTWNLLKEILPQRAIPKGIPTEFNSQEQRLKGEFQAASL